MSNSGFRHSRKPCSAEALTSAGFRLGAARGRRLKPPRYISRKCATGGWSASAAIALAVIPTEGPLARISHHPLGGWIIGCELECFFLSVAFAVEPGPVGGWS